MKEKSENLSNSDHNLYNSQHKRKTSNLFQVLSLKNEYKCLFNGCERSFYEKGNLKIHMRTHTGERPYVCHYENCGKTFITIGNLKSHICRHTGINPFKCSYPNCYKNYNRLCRFKIHLRTHTGIKPYKCEFDGCNKTFNEKGNLRVHIRTHTGEKPYKCNFVNCGKSFKAQGHLKDHSKRHLLPKRIECRVCLEKFAKKVHLKIHYLNNHSRKICFLNRPKKTSIKNINKNLLGSFTPPTIDSRQLKSEKNYYFENIDKNDIIYDYTQSLDLKSQNEDIERIDSIKIENPMFFNKSMIDLDHRKSSSRIMNPKEDYFTLKNKIQKDKKRTNSNNILINNNPLIINLFGCSNNSTQSLNNNFCKKFCSEDKTCKFQINYLDKSNNIFINKLMLSQIEIIDFGILYEFFYNTLLTEIFFSKNHQSLGLSIFY